LRFRSRSFPLAVTCALGVACSGGDSQSRDDAGSDADTHLAPDTAPDTTPDTADTAPPDTAPDVIDTADLEDDIADSVPDVPDDADTADASEVVACEYLDAKRILSCRGTLQTIHLWTDSGPSECPAYYTSGSSEYATIEALATAEDCDTDCLYMPVQTVGVLGCDSGDNESYVLNVATPVQGVTCFDAVYTTSVGLVTDLCAWDETSCSAACTCAAGDIGEVAAMQLSGGSGTGSIGQSSSAVRTQTVTAPADGVLSTVEFRLSRCDVDIDVVLTVSDASTSTLLATSRINASSLPNTCAGAPGSLDANTPGAGLFNLLDACVVVSSGQTLLLALSLDPNAPLSLCESGVCVGLRAGQDCDFARECDATVGISIDNSNPYPGGAVVGYPDQDLAFKLFMLPLAP
jgi:phosphoribosyl-AMP cyclohydrolase